MEFQQFFCAGILIFQEMWKLLSWYKKEFKKFLLECLTPAYEYNKFFQNVKNHSLTSQTRIFQEFQISQN